MGERQTQKPSVGHTKGGVWGVDPQGVNVPRGSGRLLKLKTLQVKTLA